MKPILFSAEMVRAIQDLRKTQTRRIVKPQPSSGIRKSVFVKSGLEDGHGREIKPRYQPGDILWVRETWRDRWGMAYANYGTGNAYPIDDVREIEYKAGGNGFFMHGCNLCPDEPTVKWGEWSKWRPSIFMPRDAARIFLKVKGVRVERVQDITDADILAEGFECREDFIVFWNILNEKRGHGWNKNDWVYAYTFKKISREEAKRLEGMK